MAVDISKVASSGRRQDVFVIGPDAALYHAYDDGKAWHAWENLGGKLTSAPAASWNEDMTRVDVYARGTDNALWRLVWTAAKGWGKWESMGGGLASGPAVADLSGSTATSNVDTSQFAKADHGHTVTGSAK